MYLYIITSGIGCVWYDIFSVFSVCEKYSRGRGKIVLSIYVYVTLIIAAFLLVQQFQRKSQVENKIYITSELLKKFRRHNKLWEEALTMVL